MHIFQKVFVIGVSLCIGVVGMHSLVMGQDLYLPLVPEGLARDNLYRDYLPNSDAGGSYMEARRRLIPIMEAERRAILNPLRWREVLGEGGLPLLLDGVEEGDDLWDILEATSLGALSNIRSNDTLIEPFPNNINARYWRLNPMDPTNSDEDYNVRVTVLPSTEPTDTAIFPLTETIAMIRGAGYSEIPTFTNSFMRMLRLRPTEGICQGGCVWHPTTGLRGDKEHTLVGTAVTWGDVVWACHERGGKLPSVEEAWGMLVTGTWGQNPGALTTIARASGTNAYIVLTGDVLDLYDPFGVSTSQKRLVSQVQVAGVEVPLQDNSLVQVPEYRSIVSLQSLFPSTDSGTRIFQNNTVYYCIYN